jgi:hypothetical protein
MKTKSTVALSIMVGIVIGGVAAQGVRAQSAKIDSEGELKIKSEKVQKANLAAASKPEIKLITRAKARPRPGPKPPFPAPPPPPLGL